MNVEIYIPTYDPCLFWPIQNLPHQIDLEHHEIVFDCGSNRKLILKFNHDKKTRSDNIRSKNFTYFAFSHELFHENKAEQKLFLHLTNGEDIKNHFLNFEEAAVKKSVYEYLDQGNLLLLTDNFANDPIVHENVFYHPFINVIRHYFQLGYSFLNFYPQEQKHHLLGIYHGNRPEDLSADWRNRLYKKILGIFPNDFHVYPSPEIALKDIVYSNEFASGNVWTKNHVTSYTDYNQSAVNVIWESEEEIGSRLTEKTLKALQFSKVDNFFIWYGPQKMLEILHDYGFWFLNSISYSSSQSNPVEKSVFDALIFLKNLKDSIGDNTKIHKKLLNLFGHKLNQNKIKFDQMVNICPYQDQFIRSLFS